MKSSSCTGQPLQEMLKLRVHTDAPLSAGLNDENGPLTPGLCKKVSGLLMDQFCHLTTSYNQ